MSDHYLGIDLHKRSSVWVLINKEKKVVFRRSVAVTPDAFEAVTRALPIPAKELSVVIEPVCGWLWVAAQLEKAGMDVRIANPRKVRLIADSRMKCDRIDATILAELLAVGYLPESYRAPDAIQELRALIRERHHLVCVRTGMKNRIHGILTRKGLHTMSTHPLYQQGQREITEGTDEELKRSSLVLRDLGLFLLPLDQKIEVLARTNPTIALIMTMPGIGPVTATTIYAEVGDFGRFPTPRHLSSFAGLVPSQRSSGGSEHFGHITKTGSKYIRHVLVEAAFRIRSTNDDSLAEFRERLKSGRNAQSVRVALAHKMLTILWHMVKNNTPYQPDFSLRTVK
jgi:transposase